MSTLNITDLLRELQAGEEARAKIPELMKTVEASKYSLDAAQNHNQALELSILGYKSTISDLTTKVARLEVERDDAGFRELEASDKVNTLMQTLRALAGNIDDTVRSIDPPAPEPVPQPIVQDASVSMKDDGVYTGDPRLAQSVSITDHGAERAADPTVTVEHTGYPNASSHGVPEQADAPIVPSGQSDPQAYRPFGGDAVGDKPSDSYPDGKRWYDKPTNMSIADWVAIGGQP